VTGRSQPREPQPGDVGAIGNERLTALAGGTLLLLILIELLTLPSLRALLSPHVVAGLVLAGPLTVKLGSTGYRAARYYLHAPAFVRRGPPQLPLRILAIPLAVTSMLLVATGIGLMLTGPSSAGALVPLHNLSALVWLPLIALHSLAYVRRVPELLTDDWSRAAPLVVPGRWLRLATTVFSLLGGVAAAVVLAPRATAWQGWDGFAQSLPGPVIASLLVTVLVILAARPQRRAR
jgi:hypothetical protein